MVRQVHAAPGARIRIRLVEAAGVALCHAIGRTTRCTKRYEAAVARPRGAEEGPIIVALWHGTFFPWIHFCRHREAGTDVVIALDGPSGPARRGR